MPSPAHLISKVGDPIFAAVIGLSAAATRINRQEKELGHSTQQTIDAGLRYACPTFNLPICIKLIIYVDELASRGKANWWRKSIEFGGRSCPKNGG